MSTIRTIVVEDEVGASNHLSIILKGINEKIEILTILTSVDETVEWLATNAHPDLAFFDIQLEDGLSFEVFRKCKFDFPVIFTTAFDEYAIDAFKVNSIDYLLKPIKEEDLLFSIGKYKNLRNSSSNYDAIQRMIATIESRQKTLTLLVHSKGRMIPIPDRDFSYFFIENGLMHGCTRNNQTCPVEATIEELSSRLSPVLFFRANRQFIVNRAAIVEVEFYFNGRLSLKLSPPSKIPVLISKARVPAFKTWIKG